MTQLGEKVFQNLSRTRRKQHELRSLERDSIQTLVAVKRGDEWRLAAFQNTRVRPMVRNTWTALIWLFTDWLWKVFGSKK